MSPLPFQAFRPAGGSPAQLPDPQVSRPSIDRAPIAEVRRLFEPTAREIPMAAQDGALALSLWGDETDGEPEASAIPPVEPWAHRFAQAVVEAIGGVRPVTHATSY